MNAIRIIVLGVVLALLLILPYLLAIPYTEVSGKEMIEVYSTLLIYELYGWAGITLVILLINLLYSKIKKR